MPNIQKYAVPPDFLLETYSSNGYADCYRTEIHGHISLAQFIAVFYTTSLFKLERFILTHVANKPSTDTQAQDLADDKANQFAAWTVEKRNDHEILMCDMLGRTRSWLMVQHAKEHSMLYFGSAVVPGKASRANHLLDLSLSPCSDFTKSIPFCSCPLQNETFTVRSPRPTNYYSTTKLFDEETNQL